MKSPHKVISSHNMRAVVHWTLTSLSTTTPPTGPPCHLLHFSPALETWPQLSHHGGHQLCPSFRQGRASHTGRDQRQAGGNRHLQRGAECRVPGLPGLQHQRQAQVVTSTCTEITQLSADSELCTHVSYYLPLELVRSGEADDPV